MDCPYCEGNHVGFGRSFSYGIECDGIGFVMFVSECDDCGKTVFIKAPFVFLEEHDCEVMTEEEWHGSE